MNAIVTTEIEGESGVMEKRAAELRIETADHYVAGGDMLKQVRFVRNMVDQTFDGPIAAAHTAHKAIINAKRPYGERLASIEGTIKGKMGAWQNEQERIRLARQKELRDKARRDEEDRRLADAVRLEEEGDREAAEALIKEPGEVPVVVVPRAVPKIAGVSSREHWTYEVTDIDLVPRENMMLNAAQVGQIVRAMKGRTNIPGIRAYSKDVIAVSA